MTQVGVIGFGTFGKFMCSHLKPFFDIAVYDKRSVAAALKRAGFKFAPLEVVVQRPVIIAAIPVQEQEGLWRAVREKINPDALVIDVSSVKAKPIEMMKKYLPGSCQILATHPLFGPVSGREGIAGLTIITWPVRIDSASYDKIKAFLNNELKLIVKERAPEDHDRQMAYVLSLTLFIGRALRQMQIPDSELKTRTYQHLLDLENIVRGDTEDLFRSVQLENPYAGEVRQQFLDELEKIQKELE